MFHRHRIRRLATTLASLATALLALGLTSPAAFATRWPQPSTHVPIPAPAHTLVVGGTPGWQITLIAAGTALVAAAAAVFLDRARAARRHTAMPAA